MSHHKIALIVIAAAAALDIIAAVTFAAVDHTGMLLAFYWAVYTATTTGYGDVPVTTPAAHVVAIAVMLTAIPLWTATFSLFTSGLMAAHVRKSEKRIKQHAEEIAGERRI